MKNYSRMSSQSIILFAYISIRLKETLILLLRVVLAVTFFNTFDISFFFDQTALPMFLPPPKATWVRINIWLKIPIIILVNAINKNAFITAILFYESDYSFSVSNIVLKFTWKNEILSFYLAFRQYTIPPKTLVFCFF